MMSVTELWYRAKKLYSIYPGVVAPVSGSFLADHYAWRKRTRGRARAALDAVVGAAFHAWVPFRARAVARRLGLDAGWRRRASRIAHARFVDPNDLALFRIETEAELDGYIRRFEDAGLNKLVNPLGWTPDCVLADKIRFYARCAQHGLRHPQVAATWADGALHLYGPVPGAPLLLKPARGEGGRGVRFLDPPAAGGEEWLRDQLRGLRGPWLVQARIVPHPALRDLALNALPTARMTTILDEAGRPELVNAVLRIPSDPAAAVDNMKAGGLLSAIDLADGSLEIACTGYGGGEHVRHPVTGAAIPGRVLPDWAVARALVTQAHARGFGDYALIGWDVGFAPDGPILIEGNGKPGVLMPQRAGRRGLGGQRYGELLALQLATKRTPS
ncbi:sugar-transfer associated ATP-grasp domain-containing protein [Novosphingobium soli]|uniref:Sugar-transfer associated ATP-grasp domain-containing protein n=1 Tax=Novosphingobium soli TaxID=574956 RepID=A0ABV6CU45_9SPHN